MSTNQSDNVFAVLEVLQAYGTTPTVTIKFDSLFSRRLWRRILYVVLVFVLVSLSIFGDACLDLSVGDGVEGESNIVNFVDLPLLSCVQRRPDLHLLWCIAGERIAGHPGHPLCKLYCHPGRGLPDVVGLVLEDWKVLGPGGLRRWCRCWDAERWPARAGSVWG